MDLEKRDDNRAESVAYVAPPDVRDVELDCESAPGNGMSEILGASEEIGVDDKISGYDNGALTKGSGLKKWRRIRRDLNKDAAASRGSDTTSIHKRPLSTIELAEAHLDHKPKNDVEDEGQGSTESVNTFSDVGPPKLDPELARMVSIAGFSMGVDSDNSDDRSTKVSTAASAPRSLHETSVSVRERGRVRNYPGKGSRLVLHHKDHKGKGTNVFNNPSKKSGEEHEMENSLSSDESDLRSSNSTLLKCENPVGNGWKSGKLGSFHGDHSDGPQASGKGHLLYYNENGEAEDNSMEHSCSHPLEITNTADVYCQGEVELDPFIESFVLLQATQEALETEIQKFSEIGKPHDSFDQLEEAEGSSSPLEAHRFELNQKIESLEQKLEAASVAVEEKESKVLELESILGGLGPIKQMDSDSLELLRLKCSELESAVVDMFSKKLESEMECLAIKKTLETLKAPPFAQVSILEMQKSVVEDQGQMLNKLKDSENKAITLKKHVEELEASCRELLAAEEILRLQNKVYKLSIQAFIQLMLLCAALALFVVQLFPPSNGVAPT